MKPTESHSLRITFVRLMQPSLLSFVALILLSLPAFAQNGIFVDNNVNCINTITRNTRIGDTIIHYVKTSDSTGYFLYGFSRGKAPVGNFNKIPIAGYDITDFTITNDTIFMCGVKTNGRGFYGYIKFGSAVGSVQLDVTLLCDDTSLVTNPRRIRVFNNNHGPQVVLIADCFNQDHPSGIPAVVQMGLNSNQLTVAYSSDEYFDDVELLDDNVVTVARKGLNNPTNAALYLRVSPRSSSSIFNNIFNRCFTSKTGTSDSRILLQHLVNNDIVAVYQNNTGYYVNRYWVDNSGYLQIAQHITVSVQVDKINDVAYNPADKSLMVLHGINLNHTASRFSCYPYPTISSDSLYNPAVPGIALLMSLSRIGTSKFLVSGIVSNGFMVWNTTNNGCDIKQYFPATSISPSIGYFQNQITRDYIGASTMNETLPIQNLTIPIICQ